MNISFLRDYCNYTNVGVLSPRSGDITVEDMAEVLVNNPEIILDFVITYMDKDGRYLILLKLSFHLQKYA